MDLPQIARNIRITILKMIYQSRTSHIGSAFSLVELLAYIYTTQIKEGDKLIMSKGHAGSVLYAMLAEMGKISKEFLIATYCQNGQNLGGHVTL
jgi:transketolase